MADLHPAIVLFFLSGLLVFWLTPLSAWWMLSGQPNQSARIWFIGTALYALVATVFVLGTNLPNWVRGPFSTFLSFSSLIFMLEALRREISPRPIPYFVYGGIVLAHQVIINVSYFAGAYITIGVASHLLILALIEIILIVIIEKVRRLHQSRALWLITGVLALFILSNTLRVIGLWVDGRIPMLLDFSFLSNSSLVINYVSVVFYCYGYWGFIVEKNRALLQKATIEAVEARANELIATQREELSRTELRHRSEMMQRVSTIGQVAQSAALTGSIAHEINQPLTSMILTLSEARREIESKSSSDVILGRLTRVEEDSQRIAKIVRRIKSIFEQKDPPVSMNKIDHVLQSSINILKDNFERNKVEVHTELAADLPFMFAADEIEHVFLNILQNAVESFHAHHKFRRIDIVSWAEGESIFVTIKDNGAGIPAHIKQNIFEINETSKEKGSGLGLWLARYIIERNGGKISLGDKYNDGACFILEIPVKSGREPSP